MDYEKMWKELKHSYKEQHDKGIETLNTLNDKDPIHFAKEQLQERLIEEAKHALWRMEDMESELFPISKEFEEELEDLTLREEITLMNNAALKNDLWKLRKEYALAIDKNRELCGTLEMLEDKNEMLSDNLEYLRWLFEYRPGKGNIPPRFTLMENRIDNEVLANILEVTE